MIQIPRIGPGRVVGETVWGEITLCKLQLVNIPGVVWKPKADVAGWTKPTAA